MSFDKDEIEEIMGAILAFYDPIETLLESLATSIKDPKWAVMNAINHATYYKTLKDNGINDTFAKALTKLHIVNGKFLALDMPGLSNILSKKEKKEMS